MSSWFNAKVNMGRHHKAKEERGRGRREVGGGAWELASHGIHRAYTLDLARVNPNFMTRTFIEDHDCCSHQALDGLTSKCCCSSSSSHLTAL
jgi:hypothetical protein